MLQIKTTLALLICALFILNNCGKRKPPQPPVERIRQQVNLSGAQQGDSVILNWTLPIRNASENNVQNISRIDIYRLVEPISSPLSLTEDEFASQSTLIGSISAPPGEFLKKELSYRDKLIFADQKARIRYAIRFVNSAGQKAAFSNFLLIEPANSIASEPFSLTARTSPDAVILEWEKPRTNIDGSSPANIIGYNIYRSESDKQSKKINSAPVKSENFADRLFTFEKTYDYFVRAVSVTGGAPIESSDSNAAKITPVDTFPPTAPTAITIAASPGVISLFFAANPETDIAGYRIYRSTNPDLPEEEWENLTDKILTTNTFRDNNIESGKVYYYYLAAIDNFGNISKASEVVSEKAF